MVRIASSVLSFFSLVASVGAFAPSQINQRRVGTPSISNSNRRLGYDRTTILILAAKIGVFFGSSTGNTETIAEKICVQFGEDAEGPFDIDDIAGSLADKFAGYDALVVGTPTWNTGADTERSGTAWDEIYYGEMQDLDLKGTNVAVFGLGDQESYSDNYADASGELHDVFEDLGCKMIGYTSQDGYEHDESKAIRGGKFCGLLCDEVNQEDLSDERVQNWVEQLKSEGILTGTSSQVSSSPAEVAEVPEAAPAPSKESDTIAELERENAKLRQMIEDSKMMDDVLKSNLSDKGYTPHYNKEKALTMWTSPDGKECYYTKGEPRSP